MLATQFQPISIHHNMNRITPGWDEQIVPTLRKRLESESQFLTNRLSATSFEESPPSKLNSFPQSPTFGVFQQPTAGPSSSSTTRCRTKSGPYLNDTRQVSNGNRGRQLIEEEEEKSQSINRPSPRINTSITSSPKINSTPLPSRIPTRPRSKSQLSSSSRPSPVHTRSHPPPPPLPSSGTGIPILKIRSRSPSKRSTTPSTATNTKMSVAVVEPRRESLELGGSRIKEGFIKNELPPFKMNPNEALRIAEKGHELDDQDWNGIGIGSSSNRNRTSYDNSSSTLPDRKRSISMKPDNPNSKKLHPRNGYNHGIERSGSSGSDRSSIRRNSRPSTSSATMANNSRGYGISTSHTGLGLGMGQATSTSRLSNNGNVRSTQQQQRSGSTKSPNINNSPSISGFNAPRSASLNLLSGSPSFSGGTPPNTRLGVAAHFIPPESNFTPPKDTNWDDVVLPTVAKKLGINENEKNNLNGSGSGSGDGHADDEDLAVEWDKDGTPIRWVKRKGNGGAKIGLGLGGSTGIQNSPHSNNTTPTRTHAFSPTFEPSPDNPLHPRQKASSSPLRHKPSSDGLELTPLRTTNGQALSLGQPVESSSRPNTNNAYYPGGEPFPRQNSNNSNSMHRKRSSQNISPSMSNPNLVRKPSTLKKQQQQNSQNSPNISRQGSELSLRNRQISNVSRNNTPFGPGPGNGIGPNQMSTALPGSTHRITDAIYENQLAMRENRFNEKSQSQNQNGKGNGKGKDDGTHGKSGCGCLIM